MKCIECHVNARISRVSVKQAPDLRIFSVLFHASSTLVPEIGNHLVESPIRPANYDQSVLAGRVT